jgi:large subunit ribosomal protein L11
MANVTLVRKVRLLVAAASAKPGPAIGQALGPLGLNMADFCKKFNDSTKDYVKDTPIPVTLSAFSNRTFTYEVKSPPTSYLLKKCSGLEKGSGRLVMHTVGPCP